MNKTKNACWFRKLEVRNRRLLFYHLLEVVYLAICNFDCFNCPFPDCVCSSSPLDKSISKQIDKQARTAACVPGRNVQGGASLYYQAHRIDKIKYQKQYYQCNKTDRIEYQKAYYRRNRERLKQYQLSRYYSLKNSIDSTNNGH